MNQESDDSDPEKHESDLEKPNSGEKKAKVDGRKYHGMFVAIAICSFLYNSNSETGSESDDSSDKEDQKEPASPQNTDEFPSLSIQGSQASQNSALWTGMYSASITKLYSYAYNACSWSKKEVWYMQWLYRKGLWKMPLLSRQAKVWWQGSSKAMLHCKAMQKTWSRQQ